jgi:hypothetical protein
MNKIPDRLVFNVNSQQLAAHALGANTDSSSGGIFIPPEVVEVELMLDHEGIRDRSDGSAPKVGKQSRQLNGFTTTVRQATWAGNAETTDLQGPHPFGESLDWAYRSYKVVKPTDRRIFRDYLYLFNVLVALEWHPDTVYLDQLASAFKRASDYLFDVTDGWMAFGQVVFGGPELMAGADFQLMASSHLHPRAWVGGLHPAECHKNDEKYMPILAGRGFWNIRQYNVIPWEEPEGYRTLVHEWCHYALNFKDEYLETRQIVAPADVRVPVTSELSLFRPPLTTIVMPTVTLAGESIMATTEGISEIVTHQWRKLHKLYPRIPEQRDAAEVRPGPQRLPMALPHYRVITAQTPASSVYFPAWGKTRDSLTRLNVPHDVQLERCWLYLLKGKANGSDLPARIIAQGTLESRTAEHDFPILGADSGDTVILIAEQYDNPPVVLSGAVDTGTIIDWKSVTPAAVPAMALVPAPIAPNTPLAPVSAHLQIASGHSDMPLPQSIGIYPLGPVSAPHVLNVKKAQQGVWTSKPQDMATLDGHLLMRWQDGTLMIHTFSQGGDGPKSGSTHPSNPINGGSSDGNAMLFMYKADERDEVDYKTKVITTRVHGLTGAPQGGRERGYAYSVTCNEPLPLDLSPTLILHFDPLAEEDERELFTGDRRVCRWRPETGWEPLPTYIPPGYRFAILPLTAATGGSLIDPTATLRVEYFKVCWVPRP